MGNILIHIGFAKSGSTFLQRWFRAHPQMYCQRKKFAGGFINAWELASHAQNVKSAPENFVLSCEDISVWKSEPNIFGFRGTVAYDYRNYQNVMCDALCNLYPTGKVLIVTRGYNTVFKSLYAQYVGMAGTFTFKEMIKEHWEMFPTLFDYNYVIQLYRKKFGGDKVIVLPYELLSENPAKFLSIIEASLNISNEFKYDPGKVNAAMDAKLLYAYHRISCLYYNMLKPLPRWLGTEMYRGYMNAVRNRKLHGFFESVSGIMNKEISLDGMDEMIAAMQGKAEILRNEPLYQPYLKDYLL